MFYSICLTIFLSPKIKGKIQNGLMSLNVRISILTFSKYVYIYATILCLQITKT